MYVCLQTAESFTKKKIPSVSGNPVPVAAPLPGFGVLPMDFKL